VLRDSFDVFLKASRNKIEFPWFVGDSFYVGTFSCYKTNFLMKLLLKIYEKGIEVTQWNIILLQNLT